MFANSLSMANRPYMEFDVKDAKHRQYAYNFLTTMSWKGCPYQWKIDDSSLNLHHYFLTKLVDHYMALDKELVHGKSEIAKLLEFKNEISEKTKPSSKRLAYS